MYFYIFDNFLQDKKYSNLLVRIETRIAELGLSGKMEKLSILKNIKEITEEAIKKGVDTIVIVGNDTTFSKIISFIAPHQVNLGFIPVGPHQKIADFLGIPQGEKACEILSKRIIKKIDLGKVNGNYFIFSLEIPNSQVIIECDDQYQIQSLSLDNQIKICNLDLTQTQCNPQDGFLEAIIAPYSNSWFGFFKKQLRNYSNYSIFPFKKAKIKCEHECLPLKIDGYTTIKTPVTVEVVPHKLSVIVGKQRKF